MIKKHAIVKFENSGKILQGLVLDVAKVNGKIKVKDVIWFVPKIELIEVWQ